MLMEHLAAFLSPLSVKLDELLLDPNNPRFSELGEELDQVPEHRFAESKVQKATFEKMKSVRFNVVELRDTIRELGFLPMDRLVVRPWKSSTEDRKYVVIEGNRRVTAIRWLLELHETGKITLNEGELEALQNIEVLLLDDEKAPPTARWILPGLRHVSGIKEWGPYQRARMVNELRQTGASPQEVAQSLGLSTREANQLRRAFLALEQMRNDEEYGEFAEPNLYSYFQEIFKRPNVREWLGWSDDAECFTEAARIRELYTWMKGEKCENDEGEDELGPPRLPEAKSIRELSQIIDDPKAFSLFRAGEGTLSRALAKLEADQHRDLLPALSNCESLLSTLSPDTLRTLTEEEIKGLVDLGARVTQILSDRSILIGKDG